jgi:hypothetical protein
MKKYLILALTLTALALVQSVFPSIGVVLMFSLLLMFLGNFELSVKTAFFGSLLADLLLSSHFGAATLASLLAIFVCSAMRRFFPKNVLFYALQVVVSIIIFNSVISLSFVSVFENFIPIVFKNFLFMIVLFPFGYTIYEIFKTSGIRRNF